MYRNIILLLFILLFFTSCLKSKNFNKVVNIGYQKSGILSYLKYSKILDNDLKKKNIKVSWVEFSSGPPMLEALNSGSIDFADTGETPPIFIQSSGKDVIYLAISGNVASSEGILISNKSNIKTIKDLKGKKVAFTRGSSANYTLIKLLQKAGISIYDIKSVYLQPFDARFAFENSSIDAWCVWDPYFSATQLQLGAKVLQDATFIDFIKPNFYLSRSNFIKENGDLIKTIIQAIIKIEERVKNNNEEFIFILSKITSLPINITKLIVSHWNFDVRLLDDKDITRQQKVADLFFDLKLIPNHVNIKDYVWFPDEFKIEK